MDYFPEASGLVLLNGVGGTRLDIINTLPPLGLTLVSSDFATKCSWQVYDDTHGNDYLPVVVSFGDGWNFKMADYYWFPYFCFFSITEAIISDDVNSFNTYIVSSIVDAANNVILVVIYKYKSGVP